MSVAQKKNKKKSTDKMFVVRKYVKADSVEAAIKKEKTVPIHEVFIDEDWQKKHLSEAIGFLLSEEEED